jgi:hypothetical protein
MFTLDPSLAFEAGAHWQRAPSYNKSSHNFSKHRRRRSDRGSCDVAPLYYNNALCMEILPKRVIDTVCIDIQRVKRVLNVRGILSDNQIHVPGQVPSILWARHYPLSAVRIARSRGQSQICYITT